MALLKQSCLEKLNQSRVNLKQMNEEKNDSLVDKDSTKLEMAV